jgi:hypothetical protein
MRVGQAIISGAVGYWDRRMAMPDAEFLSWMASYLDRASEEQLYKTPREALLRVLEIDARGVV